MFRNGLVSVTDEKQSECSSTFTVEGNTEQVSMLILNIRRAALNEVEKHCSLVTVLPVELFTRDTTSVKFV
jgi:hypothetical protein